MHPFLLDSATELAARIRSGDTTSEEVVEVHLEHLRRVNPAINAVVRVRLREARAEARQADRDLRERGADAVGPFHGVPCTIKESFAIRGMPQSSGLVSRRAHRSERDGISVQRLREAGAIVLGVTNVSELLMWLESNNRVYGRSNNPYDLRRIVGGSSGGEGAAVGAGIAPFGLGADIAGSIRLPAFFCGVFGHKGSSGLVPNSGQWPLAENDALHFLSTGPIARRAEDLWPLVKILAGPDGECAACRPIELGDPKTVELRSLRVLDVADNGRTPVSDDLRAAQAKVARALAEAGAHVEKTSFPAMRRSLEYWTASMSAAGGTPFGALLGGGSRKPLLPEFGRWLLRRSPHTLPALGLAVIEQVPELLAAKAADFAKEARSLRDEVSEALGEDGVMLFPTFARPAPLHYAPMLRPFDFVYTGVVNIMGLPSTQVPLGLNAQGVPLGLQVIAKHGNDHRTIAVAQHLERVFGGWVPPPDPYPTHPHRARVPGVI